MVIKAKNKAFTLVEAVISMMIIAIIAIGALPVLTKNKPQIESVTLRGQYACWWDGDQLKEWYFDERSPRTTNPINVDSCMLKLDQRPANYYIIAAGAGGVSVPAQVSTVYTPAISSNLEIEVGKTGDYNNHTTTVKAGASAEAIANGPSDASVMQKLIPANIKSCKLIQGPSCAQSCQVVEVIKHDYYTNTYTNTHKVRINGCGTTDEYGNSNTTLIAFGDLNYRGEASLADFNNVLSYTRDVISIANPHYYYAYGNVDGANEMFRLNFEFYNSSYISPERVLGFSSNTLNSQNADSKSKMSKIVDTISVRRKSVLTELISSLNAGSPRRNGAVLILW